MKWLCYVDCIKMKILLCIIFITNKILEKWMINNFDIPKSMALHFLAWTYVTNFKHSKSTKFITVISFCTFQLCLWHVSFFYQGCGLAQTSYFMCGICKTDIFSFANNHYKKFTNSNNSKTYTNKNTYLILSSSSLALFARFRCGLSCIIWSWTFSCLSSFILTSSNLPGMLITFPSSWKKEKKTKINFIFFYLNCCATLNLLPMGLWVPNDQNEYFKRVSLTPQAFCPH